MQNSKITMKELLYKMACYQELYPNVHLFEKTDLKQYNRSISFKKRLYKIRILQR